MWPAARRERTLASCMPATTLCPERSRLAWTRPGPETAAAMGRAELGLSLRPQRLAGARVLRIEELAGVRAPPWRARRRTAWKACASWTPPKCARSNRMRARTCAAACWPRRGAVATRTRLPCSRQSRRRCTARRSASTQRVVSVERLAAGSPSSARYLLSTSTGARYAARAVVNAAGVFADELNDARERASPAHRGAARRVLPVRFRVRPAVLAYRVSGAVVSGQGRARDAHRARQPAGGANAVEQASKTDLSTSAEGLRFVLDAAKKTWPDAGARGMIANFAGLRASNADGDELRHRRTGRRARVLQHRLLRLAGAHLGSGRSRARGAGGGGTAGRGGERGIPGESRALQAVRRARRGRACARHRGRPAVGAHRVPLLRGDRGRDRGRAARSAARAVARRAEVAHARDDGALPRRVLLAGDRAHRGARDGRGARRAGQAPAGIARGGRFAPRLRGAGAQGRAVGGAGRGAASARMSTTWRWRAAGQPASPQPRRPRSRARACFCSTARRSWAASSSSACTTGSGCTASAWS